MALYISIARFRRAGLDAPGVRKEAQELVDYFTAWTPPAGVTMVGLWGTVDGTQSVGVWDADSHAALTTIGAQFLPWADIEILPVVDVQENLTAQAAGGLFKLK
jgi:hypothetical protein